MQTFHRFTTQIIVISLMLLAIIAPAQAQADLPGTALDTLNVRSGPGTDYMRLFTIPINTHVNIQGRSDIGSWLLIRTDDTGQRGWVATRYISWDSAVALEAIPVTGELLDGSSPPAPPQPAAPAQANPTAAVTGIVGTTLDTLNVRSGPGTANPAVTQIPAGTTVVIEGRSPAGDWLLVHTADGSQRGWVAQRYVRYDKNAHISVVDGREPSQPQTAAPPVDGDDLYAPIPTTPYEEEMIAQLFAIPVIPAISANVRAIYRRGQELGNNPQNFIKVGDSNTVSQGYLGLIGMGLYDLGQYSGLQATIDYYKGGGVNSLTDIGPAVKAANMVTTVIDPAAGDCGAGIMPLQCAYSHRRPSIALIYLGVIERQHIDHDTYANGLRSIVENLINWGVIPVLMTAPTAPHYQQPQRVGLEFDLIVVNIARQYDVPLINVWRAMRDLPDNGLYGDLHHFTYSGVDFISFNGDENLWGYTRWNLVVLQTLDAIRQAVG